MWTARLQQKLHKVLSKAVALICKAQSGAGGWYYTPDSRSDEGSVTVTQMQALRACRNAGIVVPKKTIDRAVGYIHKSANSDGGISYSMHGGGSRPPITAAAVAVLYNAGKYDDPMAKKALKYAVRHLPVNGSNNGHHYYAQLYLAQALYQTGDERWDKHYRKMSKWLLRVQQQGRQLARRWRRHTPTAPPSPARSCSYPMPSCPSTSASNDLRSSLPQQTYNQTPDPRCSPWVSSTPRSCGSRRWRRSRSSSTC